MNLLTLGKTTLIIIVIISGAGCTTLPPLATPSGKPEITIPAENKNEAVNLLINSMLSTRYSIESQTEHAITFSRPLKGWEASATLIGIGNSYSTNPTRHAQFSVITIGDTCRIILSRYWATCENMGGRTGSMEVTNRQFFHDFQRDLNTIKKDITL
jgi:hypothetical protein